MDPGVARAKDFDRVARAGAATVIRAEGIVREAHRTCKSETDEVSLNQGGTTGKDARPSAGRAFLFPRFIPGGSETLRKQKGAP